MYVRIYEYLRVRKQQWLVRVDRLATNVSENMYIFYVSCIRRSSYVSYIYIHKNNGTLVRTVRLTTLRSKTFGGVPVQHGFSSLVELLAYASYDPFVAGKWEGAISLRKKQKQNAHT